MSKKAVLFTSPGSHHGRRVSLLVREIGIDIEERIVDVRPPGMGGENEKPEFLRLNPFGKVPVLQDGEFLLSESNAIMAYLSERHGFNALWPSDLSVRAQISRWQFLQAAHLSPAADGLLYENIIKPMLGQQPDAKAAEQLLSAFTRCANVLDEQLSRHDYLVGPGLTCADLSVGTALMYARAAGIPIAKHPPLAAWFERMRALPSWKATEPPPLGV